jgi:hypothetical protein
MDRLQLQWIHKPLKGFGYKEMSVIYEQVHLEQTERHVSTRKYMNETGKPLTNLHACKHQVVNFARIMVNFLSIN